MCIAINYYFYSDIFDSKNILTKYSLKRVQIIYLFLLFLVANFGFTTP